MLWFGLIMFIFLNNFSSKAIVIFINISHYKNNTIPPFMMKNSQGTSCIQIQRYIRPTNYMVTARSIHCFKSFVWCTLKSPKLLSLSEYSRPLYSINVIHNHNIHSHLSPCGIEFCSWRSSSSITFNSSFRDSFLLLKANI